MSNLEPNPYTITKLIHLIIAHLFKAHLFIHPFTVLQTLFGPRAQHFVRNNVLVSQQFFPLRRVTVFLHWILVLKIVADSVSKENLNVFLCVTQVFFIFSAWRLKRFLIFLLLFIFEVHNFTRMHVGAHLE